MFTVAQILQEAPPSELHFFSPSGAGGAGAMPRRMRTAYSRMRCLPHPKGWASTPMGRFCIALTYCSYHTFPHTLYLSALRADVDSVYPAFALRPSIHPSGLPLPRSFRRSPKPQDGGRTKAPQGDWVLCPASLRHPLRYCSEISGAELCPRIIAHKGPSTAFHSLGGGRMPPGPQKGRKTSCRGWHGASRFWAVVLGDPLRAWQRENWGIICVLPTPCRNLSGKITFAGGLHSDYSVADFSQGVFPESNFLGHSHFLQEGLSFIAMRLVDF